MGGMTHHPLTMDETYLQFHESYAKRVFDFVFATIGLILLSPLFLFCVLVAKLQSPGPIFYKAQRVGRGGQIFEMYKFRTMVVNADSLGLNLTTFRDTRITPIGRFLRGAKLDELPNLINVIKGDMSLIGPRPALPYEVEVYREWHRRRFEAPPGIWRHEQDFTHIWGKYVTPHAHLAGGEGVRFWQDGWIWDVPISWIKNFQKFQTT